MSTQEPIGQDKQIQPTTQEKFTKRKLLFVVHRYAPFPGGSENYVRDMAETAYFRGHDVTVLAGEHQGTHNGVPVTSDAAILFQPWDLIIVHGGDVAVQNFVLERADKLGGPVLYLLVLPSNSPICVGGLYKSSYLGCSTFADYRHVQGFQVQHKAVRVRHGININQSIGPKGFREKFGITTKYMFLSSGGFWSNKGFDELTETFNSINRDDVTLVLTGYDNRSNLMRPSTDKVKTMLLHTRSMMLSALREADLYILNSTSEGFGLVLLESMLNGTPWAARNIAGAETLREFGFTYDSQDQLAKYMKDFIGVPQEDLSLAQNYVIGSHQIAHTVSDILRILT